jgi:hypothetical protein
VPTTAPVGTGEDFRLKVGSTAANNAQAAAEADTGGDDEEGGRHGRGTGLRLSISSQLSMNDGTFRIDENVYSRNAMVAWSASFSPSYTFKDTTRISASATVNQELTLADGDDDPQTLLFGDVGLNLSRSIYKFSTGTRLSGSLSGSIPTSDASQASTLRTTLGAGLSLSHPLNDQWSLSFSTTYRKNFHEYTSPVRDPRADSSFRTRDGLDVVDLSTAIVRQGSPDLRNQSTYVEASTNNTSFSWSNGIGVSYTATEKLSFSLNYQLTHSWTYESFALDELSGVGATDGRGRRDTHGASLSASYQLLDNLGLSAGIANGGSPRTADDRRIRIPFLSYESQDLTIFSLGISYSQPVPL